MEKTELLQKTLSIFMEIGVKNVSMDDISQRLRISKKTLYRHFANKNDLIKSIFELILEQHKQNVFCFDATGMNAIDILFEVSKIIGSQISKMNPTVKFELEKYYPEVYNNFLIQKREIVFHGVIENIKQGIKENLYRENLEAELIAGFYIKKMESLHDSDFFTKTEYSIQQIFETMFEQHIRSIASVKGIEYLESQIVKIKNLNTK